MKPKPLDLEEIKKKIFERFCEELFGTKKPRDITEWSDIGKIGGEHGIDAEEIEELVEFTINKTLQHIRKACEFYLRYKDNPELLIKEHPELKRKCKRLNRWAYESEYKPHSNMAEYNEWLFRLVFKEVVGCD